MTANCPSDPGPNPCRGCGERRVGCHGTCQRYLGWAEAREHYRNGKRDEAARRRDMTEYQTSFRRKLGYHRRRT